jgi:hypothetical protein
MEIPIGFVVATVGQKKQSARIVSGPERRRVAGASILKNLPAAILLMVFLIRENIKVGIMLSVVALILPIRVSPIMEAEVLPCVPNGEKVLRNFSLPWVHALLG